MLGDDRHTSCPTVTLGRKTTDAKTFLDRLHGALFPDGSTANRAPSSFTSLPPKGQEPVTLRPRPEPQAPGSGAPRLLSGE